ncbi:MAG: NHL repeat-containing protein, partial [Deltaproteobacteria bacterium]
MKESILVTLSLFVSWSITTHSLHGGTFGPNEYVRAVGQPTVYTDTFSSAPGSGLITVRNGHWDGSNRVTNAVTSARIVLNEEQIFGPNDFKDEVHILETSVDLAEQNTISVELNSDPGSYITVEVTQQGLPPRVTMHVDPDTIRVGGSATLTWVSTHAHSASIDHAIGDVPVNGSIIVSPAATTNYTITVTNPAGTATDQSLLTVRPAAEPQPEGSFGGQYEDLIPPDATVERYDPRRFSLITGRVHAIDDAPLLGVSVTILDHPEYGTASTDDGGRFSIPVEGGGMLTVVYEKAGLITVHRKVYVPWNDIVIAETIRMIAEDPAATSVTFDGNPDTVVRHQSTQVSDEFGSRSCTMVFTGDNQAYEIDDQGNIIKELTTITTRATEYSTPESMPAKLPPNSAYTYCAELSVEGAERVLFNRPIITWVDNFLGFSVGEPVPLGYYDRAKGMWVPSDNGVVVKLLDTDTDGIVDALDANGDDQPDDLNGDGLFGDEVKGLNDATKYAPGSTFWRAAVTHFTPWDWNWPFDFPQDAIEPNPEGKATADQQNENDEMSFICSYVEDRSRIFHEDNIPVPGTDMTLHYSSNRVKGYKTVISVPASGPSVPASLKNIVIKLHVAGRTVEQTIEAQPNQIVGFTWDGFDHLGRPLNSATAHVSVGFVYDGVYLSAPNVGQAFAQAGIGVTGIAARQEVVSWKQNSIQVGKTAGSIAEGWTLSSHHYVNPMEPHVLYTGDGAIRKNLGNLIDTVAGDGTYGYSGDGSPATEAQIGYPWGITVDASGNIFISDIYANTVRKVDTNGIITTVAGNGTEGYSGDGGPATEAQLDTPMDVAVDGSGNLYIVDGFNDCIRKVDTNGIISTVAGTGTFGYSGDGGPATQAQLGEPGGVAVDAFGNLYIADTYNYRIRKVDTNGTITTVAGNGDWRHGGDGGPATQAHFGHVYGVAVDASGNLYMADYFNSRIRKVDASGTITTLAGNGTRAYSGDGGPATQAEICLPMDVAIDAVGNLYIADTYNNRIRKVDASGTITTVAGDGTGVYSGDGGPATEARIASPFGVAVDASGDLYIEDTDNFRIRKVISSYALGNDESPGDISFLEYGIGHVMSGAGLHKSTFETDSGVTLRTFGYDQGKNLISIA